MFKSLKAKLVSTIVTIAGVASVFAFAVSSFAWYHSYKKSVVNDMTLKTIVQQSVDIIEDHFEVYYFDVEQDRAVLVEDDFILAPYNMFVPARNIYNRKFIRMSLRYPGNASSGDNLRLTLTCTGDLLKEDGKTEAEYISNLIQFKFYDNYEGAIRKLNGDVTVQNVYEDCVNVFDNIDNKVTFVSLNQEEVAIKSEKVVAMTVEMPSLKDKTKELLSDFIMEIDYSEVLIDYFKNHGGYDFNLSYFEKGDKIEFVEDIESIYLSIAD